MGGYRRVQGGTGGCRGYRRVQGGYWRAQAGQSFDEKHPKAKKSPNQCVEHPVPSIVEPLG